MTYTGVVYNNCLPSTLSTLFKSSCNLAACIPNRFVDCTLYTACKVNKLKWDWAGPVLLMSNGSWRQCGPHKMDGDIAADSCEDGGMH